MARQCLHYKYNNTLDPCNGSYEKCAKLVDCTSNEHHCFLVLKVDGPDITAISAGCNPPYGPSMDQKCAGECIVRPKGPRYYCCCTDNLCNRNYTLPTRTQEPNAHEINSTKTSAPNTLQPEVHQANGLIWSVIPIVLILTMLGAYVYKQRRSVNHTNTNGSKNKTNNRRCQVAENGRELSGLGSNQLMSLLTPFRNTIDENNFNSNNRTNNGNNYHLNKSNTNNNVNNNNHSHLTSLTNHHDANNCIMKQHNDNGIDLSSLKIYEIVGSGRFGTVHRASLNDKEIAVKMISSTDYHSWLSEQQIYSSPKIKHPNILDYFFSHEHPETESYWLIVEYASKGSLHSFLKDNTVIWKEFLHIALGVVHGLSHLHEADIAHRDFKSKNVLLKSDLTPCITDFGVACILDTTAGSQLDHRKKYSQVGTPRYMAPEVLECSVTFTKASFTKIDVYALSLVLWELLSRCHFTPEQVARLRQQLQQNLTREVDEAIDSNHPSPSAEDCVPPPYKLPFEDVAGPNPDINKMRQIVVVEKLRPILKEEWRAYPASVFCRAIEDGWEYDQDARISASCFVERVESLQQIAQQQW